MGISIRIRAECDCDKPKDPVMMERIAQKIDGSTVETLFYCHACKKYTTVITNLTYTDMYKGVRNV